MPKCKCRPKGSSRNGNDCWVIIIYNLNSSTVIVIGNKVKYIIYGETSFASVHIIKLGSLLTQSARGEGRRDPSVQAGLEMDGSEMKYSAGFAEMHSYMSDGSHSDRSTSIDEEVRRITWTWRTTMLVEDDDIADTSFELLPHMLQKGGWVES